jgi:two-component system, NarL family, nitrate/nitrite response regulator NarL
MAYVRAASEVRDEMPANSGNALPKVWGDGATMKVLAADGYILCCGLLRTLALIYHDIQVMSANSVDEVLAGILKLPDLDLVLLDVSMPGMENFGGLRRVVENLGDAPVIVTSASESHTQIIAAIRNGARGYILASSKPCVLQHALPLVIAGEFYIPASALRGEKAGALRAAEWSAPRITSCLTQRQREITIMLAEGKSNKEIARELKLLEGTVKLHVRGVLRSLGVRNRTEAAIAALRAGYLPKRTVSSGPPTSKDTGGDADHKTPEASASSPPSRSGIKHTPPTGNGPPLLPAYSTFNVYDAGQNGANELLFGRRRTRAQ